MVIKFETGIKHDTKVFHFDAVVNSSITEVKRDKFLILTVIPTSTIDDQDFSLFDVHFKFDKLLKCKACILTTYQIKCLVP